MLIPAPHLVRCGSDASADSFETATHEASRISIAEVLDLVPEYTPRFLAKHQLRLKFCVLCDDGHIRGQVPYEEIVRVIRDIPPKRTHPVLDPFEERTGAIIDERV